MRCIIKGESTQYSPARRNTVRDIGLSVYDKHILKTSKIIVQFEVKCEFKTWGQLFIWIIPK